ncbi:Type-1 restriction enzyme R protein [uncultured Blautia sp.]|nr:DEAD/DEAH box helicase [uncultured Blautia sp.]SCG92045.1 Type-1 restriction enzyme R protein [uncultured Blautia sp.]
MGIQEKLQELRNGFETAYIDKTSTSNLAYKPQFISNDHKQGKKVLSSIEDELMTCDQFQISVAFITMGGITPLLQILQELEEKGIKGEILTTNYLSFSEPEALKKLNALSNITLKMYDVDKSGEGFHTKGYIFRKAEIYRIIIGSSNITKTALTTNREWNTRIVSTSQGEMAKSVVDEFYELWNSKYALDFDEFYENYKKRYELIKKQRKLARSEEITSIEKYRLQPNSMQIGFITNLQKIVEAGEKCALLISATGTGKTYASAFAMRELGYKRVLFLVHRGQIAKQALESYKKVFNKSVSMGMVTGKHQDYNADYIFATIQTLSKEDVLEKYDRNAFDAIVIDEAHHSSANSYKKVMEYFTPKLWLGMTATPDKRDDNLEGRNIYEIFNHQIAYEIRLQDAMEEDLLCTFHYFGITDLKTISDAGKSSAEKMENFIYLTSDERVEHVMKQAEYFGHSGERVKGLIFCSRIDEANVLSDKFNKKGWRTEVLSGSNSEAERVAAIEKLAGDESEDALDYILSVDIFSEGVDVPEINQVIMLRPTESPIVFIQQLGRGLRKAVDKEYVVILDFIGNYRNNFMIPIALSGDRSYNKDNIRRYVTEGGRIIPGASTIHFDEISRKRIFQAVDNANFSDIKLIRENYINLKNKLGHIPALADFDKYGEMDVLRIFDNNSLGSYYKFLVKYEKEYKIRLSTDEEKVIEFISKKLASGKRIHELELLKRLLTYKHGVFNQLREVLSENYHCAMDENCAENIINMMTNEFPTSAARKTYVSCVFLEKEEQDYGISSSFEKMLQNPEFYRILEELVDFGISRYKQNYSCSYQDTNLVLYQKYTYEDACRLLNWEKNEVPLNIGGYKYDKKTRTFPIFINYDKQENISDTTKYEDHFISSDRLIAISKSGRSIDSEDVQNFLKAKERGIDVQLFVRKNKDDKISKEFYYFGRVVATGAVKQFVMPNTDKTAVEIEWRLETPVREDIYEYIVNN